MEKSRFINSILLAVLALTGSCVFHAHHPDPLAGWNLTWSQDPNKVNAAVLHDYKHYIETLPPNERERVGIIEFFEDGTGRRAVKFEIGIKGTVWAHILIYDENNKRIKRIKYANGGYQS